MSESKSNPKRQGKAQAYSQKAQATAQLRKTPRTRIVPDMNWQSTDEMVITGQMLEGWNKTIEVMWHGLQQLGQIYQAALAMNAKSEKNPNGKIEIVYRWDNGEDVSAAELATFKAKMAQMQALQEKQKAELQQKAAILEDQKPKSNLVDENGAPLSEESVNESKIIS